MSVHDRLRGVAGRLFPPRSRAGQLVGLISDRLFAGPPRFSIDGWQLEERAGEETLHMAGWCFAAGGRTPVTLRLVADDRVLDEVVCQRPRDDIARAFPFHRSAAVGTCGFEARILIPAGTRHVRLETVPEEHILAGDTLEALRAKSLQFRVETFALAPAGSAAQLHVSGWCFNAAQPNGVTLELHADDGVLSEIPCRSERADVVHAFADGPRRIADVPPLCGFDSRTVIPADARAVRLVALPDHRVLAEESLEVLRTAALQFTVETFTLEPMGAAARLRVVGWCFAPGRATPMTLRLVADDHLLAEIRCTQRRDDIARAFSGSDNAAEAFPLCGFAASIVIPADARVLRLETAPNGRVLAEDTLAALRAAALRYEVETFTLEPVGAAAQLHVEGWCFAPGQMTPVTLRLMADDRLLEEFACGGQRDDIARAFGADTSAAEAMFPPSGFRISVPIPDGSSALSLEAVADGRVLMRETLAALRVAALRFDVETFKLEPFGRAARLRLEGWCFAPGQTTPVTLRVSADDRLLDEIPCSQERDDIARAFASPESGTTDALLRCGFATWIPIPSDARVLRLDADQRVLAENTLEALRAASLQFAVETLRLETFHAAEHLSVEGWCFTPGQGTPMRLQLTADDDVLATITCDHERDDIARAYAPAQEVAAEASAPWGFSAGIPIVAYARLLRLETEVDHRVLIETTLDALRAGTLRSSVEAFALDSIGATERLRIEGWCYARGDTEPVRLRLTADGEELRQITCVRERADVAVSYGRREGDISTPLPRCGFLTWITVPSGAEVLRLESPAHNVVLVERTVNAILAWRWAVETFRLEAGLTPEIPPVLVLQGWLYPRQRREVARVHLWADDDIVLDLECGIERPDVEQAFIHFEDAALTPLPRCGFRAQVALPAGRFLRVKAEDGTVLIEGERAVLLDAAGLGAAAEFVSTPQTRWLAHVTNNTLQPHVHAMLARAVDTIADGPMFTIVVTVRNQGEIGPATQTLRSLQEQVYPRWELAVAAPPALRASVREALTATDAHAVQIAEAEDAADVAAVTAGEWLCLLSAGDLLVPHALFEVARALQEHPGTDLVYADEDVIDGDGLRRDPSFKPVWSPTRLLSHDYIGRPAFIRRATYAAAGGFADGEHALWLRLAGNAVVRHVPGILCHRKPWARADPIPTVAAHLAHSGSLISAANGHGAVAVVEGGDEGPSVEIIIPTRNRADILRRCLESLSCTRYRPFSITVVDDRSDDGETLALLRDARARGVKVLRCDDPGGFSFARLNNRAVEDSEAELVLLLNNDTEVRNPRWLSRMVALLDTTVGAVGARLLYPDGTLQHAGVHLWLNGLAPGHELLGWPGDVPSPGGRAEVGREVAAVTAACLLTPRRVWRAVGGLDERFPVSLNDIDYCLRLADAGWRTIYAGGAELLHHEAASRGRIQDPAELALFRARYARRADPFCNPNLDGSSVTPECRLDFAAFKDAPLRVSIIGATWEASVVRDALAAVGNRRRIAVVAQDADVVVATGLLGHRTVNAAADADRPVLWAHGGPLGLPSRPRRVPREEESAYERALARATWVVFGSAEARELSRAWQRRENFVFNRIAINPSIAATAAARDAEPCRIAWVGEGDADSDPQTFVRAFHRLRGGLPLAASWLCWGNGARAHEVTRAEAFDRRAAPRSGTRLGAPAVGTVAALNDVDVFVSTGTGLDDPRPLLHATASGCAILAPQECGLSERAAVGVNAWTYLRDDSRALARRIEALVADPQRRTALARSSRHVFGCLATFDEMAERWADLLWGTWHMGSGRR